MPITISLFDALRQIVLLGREIAHALWVDALCINQADDEDRSEQVAMMGSIYSKAKQVLIWLGDGPGRGASDVVQFWRHASSLCQPDSHPPEEAVRAADTFLQNHEWFMRVWTFQEVVLAREAILQLGPYSVPWETAITYLGRQEGSAISVIDNYRKTYKTDSLLDLCRVTWKRQASDPRDKIYWLLGVYRHGERLTVNYQYSLKKIHAECLAKIFIEMKQLAFLALLPLEYAVKPDSPHGIRIDAPQGLLSIDLLSSKTN